MLEKVRDRIGPYIYSEDDEDLSCIVLRKLLEDGVRLSVAESCTGGSFAAAVTEMPGVSAIFDRSIVTYSNDAKIQELGVKPETLQTWGAVSAQVAEEMAEGLTSQRQRSVSFGYRDRRQEAAAQKNLLV